MPILLNSVKRKWKFTFVTLAILLFFLETSSFLVGLSLIKKGWMAYLPHFSKAQIKRTFQERDPLLGWGPRTDILRKTGHLAPRPDPALPLNSDPHISVYGDSFTFGAAEDATYPHYIAVALGCPVANYGVLGYGSDQAFMLWRVQKDLDKASIVILGHLSENILRNVNQYRNLLYPGGELLFKPRFIEKNERLVYVPMAVKTEQDFSRLRDYPEALLEYEFFLRRPRFEFPFSLSLLRWLMMDFHVRAELKGIPRHMSFYSPTHASGGFSLTALILTTFSQEALSSKKTPVVLLIPTCKDILFAKINHVWPDQPLADALKEKVPYVIHAGPELLKRLGQTPPEKIYDSPNGHFNPQGYQMLARVIVEFLQNAQIL